jgi:hypothetical protein
VNFTLVHLDHRFFNSTFLSNGHHGPAGLFENNTTKVPAIHLEAFWQIIEGQ